MRLSNKERFKLASLATDAVRTQLPFVTCDKTFHIANGIFAFVFNDPTAREKVVITSDHISGTEFNNYCVKRNIKFGLEIDMKQSLFHYPE